MVEIHCLLPNQVDFYVQQANMKMPRDKVCFQNVGDSTEMLLTLLNLGLALNFKYLFLLVSTNCMIWL